MVKSDVIVRHLSEEGPVRVPSRCPWHVERDCLFLYDAENGKRFHCLLSNQSRRWYPYGVSRSCDLSEEMHDLRVLKTELGGEHVLPFAYVFRERSGCTVGAFELRDGLLGPEAIDRDNLSEVFYAMVVFLCAICRRLGGSVPVFKLASFLYTRTHPVLTNVGSANSDKRFRVGGKENFSRRNWNKFLGGKTCADVFNYLKHARPEVFKKKCRKGETCHLREKIRFDDETHELVCRTKKAKIVDVLSGFVHLAKEEKIRLVVRRWIDEHKLFVEAEARRKAARANETIVRGCSS